MTQHAPPPVSLPRDDAPAAISSRSPPPFSPARPAAPNQSSRDSPPPPTKTTSQPTSPAPPKAAPRSSPQPEAKPELKAAVEEDEEDEAEADGEPINMDTFNQILELDDEEEEDEHEFSRGMVYEYFAQVEKTFGELDTALEAKDLPELSSLGHFLKGSSAALGVTHVQASCEKIQHYGALRDEENSKDLTQDQALSLIRRTLVRCKKDYTVADKWLREFYNEPAEVS